MQAQRQSDQEDSIYVVIKWELNTATKKMPSSNHPERAPRDKEQVILTLEGTDPWHGWANGTQGSMRLPQQQKMAAGHVGHDLLISRSLAGLLS